jgi:NADPH:quinone reductase-like Zn-dependent oxidoreductase
LSVQGTGRQKCYDRIFVAVGNRVHPPSRADCGTALAHDGAYVSVDERRPKHHTEDLLLLRQLAETGLRPVIDRCYPPEQMAEAHRYVEAGHKKENVIVTVGHEPREPGSAISGT